MRALKILTLLIAFALPTLAAGQTPSVEDLQKALAAYKDYADKLNAQNAELRKRVEGKEAALWDKYYEAKQRDYTFQEQMLDINYSSFTQQRIASYVILAMVVVVVGAGLWFAKIQLMAGLAPISAAAIAAANKDANAPPPPPAAPLGATTFSAELGKVTITSSVVGIIVLAISLAFLYIYTHEIYHIQVIDPYRPKVVNPDQADQTTTKQK